MVARFLRSENIIPAQAEPTADGRATLRFAHHAIEAPTRASGQVTFVVRPEAIRLVRSPDPAPNTIEATLVDQADRGVYQRLEFDAGVQLVVFRFAGDASEALRTGERYRLSIPPEAIHVLEN